MKYLCLIIALLTLGAVSSRAASVSFEAESGTLGADFAVSNSTSPQYITITSNGAGNNPGSAARVATYTIPFPAAGTYLPDLSPTGIPTLTATRWASTPATLCALTASRPGHEPTVKFVNVYKAKMLFLGGE